MANDLDDILDDPALQALTAMKKEIEAVRLNGPNNELAGTSHPPRDKQPSRYLAVQALATVDELMNIIENPKSPVAAKSAAKLWLDSILENSGDLRRKAYAEILDRIEGKATQRAILDTQITGRVVDQPAERDVKAWELRHKQISSRVVDTAGQITHDDPELEPVRTGEYSDDDAHDKVNQSDKPDKTDESV